MRGTGGSSRSRWRPKEGLLCGGDGFRGLLESFVLRTLQQFCDIEENDQTAFEFSYSRDVAGFTFRKNRSGRIDFRGWNLQDFGRGVYNEPDQFVFQLNDEDAILLVRNDLSLTEALAEIHDWNNFSTEIDHTFDELRRARNGGNLGNANNLAHGGDANAVHFITDPETNNMQILFHRKDSS